MKGCHNAMTLLVYRSCVPAFSAWLGAVCLTLCLSALIDAPRIQSLRACLPDFLSVCCAGVFSFDIADDYGPSETLVGRFLRLNPRHMDQGVVMTRISFMGRPEPEQLKGDIIG
jgi:hypothetical protein